jgi:hypothetical protein
VYTIKPRIPYKGTGDANIESVKIELVILVDFPEVLVALVLARKGLVLKTNQIPRAAFDGAPEGNLLRCVEGFDVTLQVRRARKRLSTILIGTGVGRKAIQTGGNKLVKKKNLPTCTSLE